jgi:hypothetical protein
MSDGTDLYTKKSKKFIHILFRDSIFDELDLNNDILDALTDFNQGLPGSQLSEELKKIKVKTNNSYRYRVLDKALTFIKKHPKDKFFFIHENELENFKQVAIAVNGFSEEMKEYENNYKNNSKKYQQIVQYEKDNKIKRIIEAKNSLKTNSSLKNNHTPAFWILWAIILLFLILRFILN